MVQAVLLHPLVLPRLAAKLAEKGAAREAHWTALLQRRLFARASDGGSNSLGHLVCVLGVCGSVGGRPWCGVCGGVFHCVVRCTGVACEGGCWVRGCAVHMFFFVCMCVCACVCVCICVCACLCVWCAGLCLVCVCVCVSGQLDTWLWEGVGVHYGGSVYGGGEW